MRKLNAVTSGGEEEDGDDDQDYDDRFIMHGRYPCQGEPI